MLGLRKFIINQEGQGTVEYLVILSASVLGAAALAQQMKSIIDRGILRLGAQIEKDLKVGRAPLNVWQN